MTLKIIPTKWQTPFVYLALASIAMSVTFSAWLAMLNNFAINNVNFTGAEIGLLQSLREVPGFLAFTAVFILLVLKEQTFAVVSLALMSIGVAITGFFPTIYGLYATTVLMSVGYHYYETINQSLSLQWFNQQEAPEKLGKLLSVKSAAALFGYGAVWVAFSLIDTDYKWIYFTLGSIGLALTLLLYFAMPEFNHGVPQDKKLIIKKRYSLYYLLTFFSGA